MTIQTLLNSSPISNRGWAKLTGINETLIHQYKVGLKIPRKKQREKFKTAAHELGKELMEIQLT